MSTFKAINIESDDESDEEIDNTKEIQIEEALKLYQTALKLHSQDSTLHEAGAAYEALFKSEIFNYSESQSEYNRVEPVLAQDELDAWYFGDVEEVSTVGQATDSAPSTLPQLLHLSFKNKGEHRLDLLRSSLKNNNGSPPDFDSIKQATSEAVSDFADALDKDELDTDLWRRTARVGQVLGAPRISRFCLECTIGDEDDVNDVLALSTYESSADVHELRRFQQVLQDDLSLAQLSPPDRSLERLPVLLRNRLRPYPFLPESSLKTSSQLKIRKDIKHVYLNPTEHTWESVGQAILERLRDEQIGKVEVEAGTPIAILLPPKLKQNSVVRDIDTAPPQASSNLEQVPPIEPEKDLPTVETDADVVMHDGTLQGEEQSTNDPNATEFAQIKVLPDRKRSVEEADLPETGENGRSRSKRIKSRPSTFNERALGLQNTADAIAAYEKQLEPNVYADQSLHDTIDILLQNAGLAKLNPAHGLRHLVSPATQIPALKEIKNPLQQAFVDFYSAMQTWNDKKSTILERKSQFEDASVSSRSAGLTTFLEDSNPIKKEVNTEPLVEAIQLFADAVNARWLTTMEVAVAWLQALTMPFSDNKAHMKEEDHCAYENLAWGQNSISKNIDNSENPFSFAYASSYLLQDWSEELKRITDQILVAADETLHQQLAIFATDGPDYQNAKYDLTLDLKWIQNVVPDLVGHPQQDDVLDGVPTVSHVTAMIQSLYELHLDIYYRITGPASTVEQETRISQGVKVDKWARLARELVSMTVTQSKSGNGTITTLALRHIWSTVFHLQGSSMISREHLMLCIEDLKTHFEDGMEYSSRPSVVEADQEKVLTTARIKLRNNSMMPELSVAAADREISKLETMDFFLSIFQGAEYQPVDLIEKLEPILLLTRHLEQMPESDYSYDSMQQDPDVDTATKLDDKVIMSNKTSSSQMLTEFLQNASSSLRLSLWDRLRDAYSAIDYPPKVFSIYMESLRVILNDLQSLEHHQMPTNERQKVIIQQLGKIKEIIISAAVLIQQSDSIFECIDVDDLLRFLESLTQLFTILYAVSLFDDYSQATQKGAQMMNPFRTYPVEAFHGPSITFHDMQVRVFMLMYQLFHECMKQLPEQFPTAVADRLIYLRSVHHSLGVRRLCKASDSKYLQFMQTELSCLAEAGEDTSHDLAQILYDLYDLQLFTIPTYREDHGCEADYLERATAMELMNVILEKSRNTNIKEFLKPELAKTVERIHSAIMPVKHSQAILQNRKVFAAYIKSPINPVQVFRSVQGIAFLSTRPVKREEAIVAAKGWFFLMGQLNLAKYRSQRAKGIAPSSDDIMTAIGLLTCDIEYDAENWESWFRLGQANDALIEENVLWSAEHINAKTSGIALNQRIAIHAYAMAVATAIRSKDATLEISKLSELYSDFGTRIYSSTRAPFSMKAFSLAEFGNRFCSSTALYEKELFPELRTQQAYKFAAVLFRRALVINATGWLNHYMLGKCLWKIHKAKLMSSGESPSQKKTAEVIETFWLALRNSPRRKDPKSQEPLIEPIYKLVVILHKLVLLKAIEHTEAESNVKKALQEQRQFEATKIPDLSDFEGHNQWNQYVLEIFRMMRAADKSKWHHRVILRIADLLYKMDDCGKEGAKNAKDYLLEQHVYSAKTLTIVVWKPENERPGRHWIYNTRYARFLIELIEKTDDLEGIQLLVRRVKRKPNEFYQHAKLWGEVCAAYIKLHRRYADIPIGTDDIFRTMSQEDFNRQAVAVDAWCVSADSKSPLLDVLREVAELRKLITLTTLTLTSKTSAIDELLEDTYGAILIHIGPSLATATARSKETDIPLSAPTAENSRPPEKTGKDARSNIMSLNHLMNVDGMSESTSTLPPPIAPAIRLDNQPLLAVPSRPIKTKTVMKSVNKRDILKHIMDASVPKVAATPASAKPAQRALGLEVRVVIDNTGPSKDEVKDVTPVEGGSKDQDTTEQGQQHQANGDEESELSEAVDYDDDDDDEDDQAGIDADNEQEDDDGPETMRVTDLRGGEGNDTTSDTADVSMPATPASLKQSSDTGSVQFTHDNADQAKGGEEASGVPPDAMDIDQGAVASFIKAFGGSLS